MKRVETILNGLFKYRLSPITLNKIEEAIKDIEDPLKILAVCDSVVKERHPYGDGTSNPLKMFSDPWNPYIQDKIPEIEKFNKNFKAFSLGSGRGRESPFVPSVLNGGLILKNGSEMFLYDPGIDFHYSISMLMKYLGKLEIPSIRYIFVSHSHFDHASGVGNALSLLTKFFREKRDIIIISPDDVYEKYRLNKKPVPEFVKIFKSRHGRGIMNVEVFHFLIEDKILLISDSQIFKTIGKLNPRTESIPADYWIDSIERGNYVLTQPLSKMINEIGRIGGVDTVYLTFQCSDILPGDFPKISTAYFLGKNKLAKNIILSGWGSENVFGGNADFPRIELPVLWSYALNLMFKDINYVPLLDFNYII